MSPALHSFSYALDYLREQVSDLAPEQMVAQPNGFRNHPAWVIGHLSFTSQELGGALGLPPWLPDLFPRRYGTGSVPVSDVAVYESKNQSLAILRQTQERLILSIEGLTESELDRPFPDPAYLDVFPTIRHALTQVLVGHTAYHVGQIAAWRRAMGLAPMSRGFE